MFYSWCLFNFLLRMLQREFERDYSFLSNVTLTFIYSTPYNSCIFMKRELSIECLRSVLSTLLISEKWPWLSCRFRWQVRVTRRLCPAHRASWMCSMTRRSFNSLWKSWTNCQKPCGLSLQSHCTNTAKISRSSRERERAENITIAYFLLHFTSSFPVSSCIYIWVFYSNNKNKTFKS